LAKLPGTSVVSFQRDATWITQSLGQALGVGEGAADGGEDGDEGVDMGEGEEEVAEEVGSNFNPRYTGRDKRRFADPKKHRAYRKMLQHGMNKGFRLVRTALSSLSDPSSSIPYLLPTN
jgi:hypothetical protein